MDVKLGRASEALESAIDSYMTFGQKYDVRAKSNAEAVIDGGSTQ